MCNVDATLLKGELRKYIFCIMLYKEEYYTKISPLTLNLLTTTIVAPPSNASKWQMGFNSAFKGLNIQRFLLFVSP